MYTIHSYYEGKREAIVVVVTGCTPYTATTRGGEGSYRSSSHWINEHYTDLLRGGEGSHGSGRYLVKYAQLLARLGGDILLSL